jgi:inhibitor of cysteine peptidase
LTQGIFYLVTVQGYWNPQEADPKTFLPACYTTDGVQRLSTEQIAVSNSAAQPEYAVISSIAVNSGDWIDRAAILGSGSTLYMSEQNLWLAQNLPATSQTVLTRLSYQSGSFLDVQQTVVEGSLTDAYWMDEQNGCLRLITTEYQSGENRLMILGPSLEELGSIVGIAPGESLKSVRFLGDFVYFVTFLQTDPLFVADLSNPENPALIDELTLSGFSNQLIEFGDGMFAGVGVSGDENGNTYGIKLAMFASDHGSLSELDSITIGDEEIYYDCEALDNRQAIFTLPQEGLAGFGTAHWSEDEYLTSYHLFFWNGSRWQPRLRYDLTEPTNWIRAFTNEKWIYLVTPDNVIPLTD